MKRLVLLALIVFGLAALLPAAGVDVEQAAVAPQAALADECDGVDPTTDGVVTEALSLLAPEAAQACAGGGTYYTFWHWESWANHWDCVIVAAGVEIERIHGWQC